MGALDYFFQNAVESAGGTVARPVPELLTVEVYENRPDGQVLLLLTSRGVFRGENTLNKEFIKDNKKFKPALTDLPEFIGEDLLTGDTFRFSPMAATMQIGLAGVLGCARADLEARPAAGEKGDEAPHADLAAPVAVLITYQGKKSMGKQGQQGDVFRLANIVGLDRDQLRTAWRDAHSKAIASGKLAAPARQLVDANKDPIPF